MIELYFIYNGHRKILIGSFGHIHSAINELKKHQASYSAISHPRFRKSMSGENIRIDYGSVSLQRTLIFISMAQNVLLLTMIVLKFILMMIFLSSNLIILIRRGELSQKITLKSLKNSMLTLKSLHSNRDWNSLKKSKFQKGKF